MKTNHSETLTTAMRDRLCTNRHGRLTTDQWKEIVTEPLVLLLLALPVLLLVLGPRLAFLVGRGWLIGLGLVLLFGLVTVLRAVRYARAPVQVATLCAQDAGLWRPVLWKPVVLYRETGEGVRFAKRLAPTIHLRPDQRYLVYYLKEGSSHVLLSMAPADHPDAAQWQPSELFETRLNQRSRA
jgi:hypothetical protein